MSGDRFPYRVRSVGDLPEPLRPVLVRETDRGTCTYALVAPPFAPTPVYRGSPPPSYLLMIFDDRLSVASLSHFAEVDTTDVPFDELVCVELRVLLLYSWMKLVFGRVHATELVIPFNTVGLAVFRDVVALIRRAVDVPGRAARTPAVLPQEIPFKFRTALEGWLEIGEVPSSLAFQPEVRAPRFRLFRVLPLFERQVVPPLLAVLTNRELLLIAEERMHGRAHLERYGEVFTYCPLSRVDTMTIRPRDDASDLRDLRLDLAVAHGHHRIDAVVTAARVPEFERLGRLAVCQPEKAP